MSLSFIGPTLVCCLQVSPPISDKMRLERFAVIQRKAIADNDLVSLVTEFRAVLME